MQDPTIRAIDRLFDLVDSGVEKIDHVLNRTKSTEEQHRARRKRSEVIDATPTPTPTKPAKKDASARAPASASGLVHKARFYIVESITDGTTLFVVTDGGKARTECSTREFAEKILRALEASS